jgi:hypothetical protein
MMHFQTHLKRNKLIQRSLIFLGSMIIIIAISLFHGISGGEKSTEMIDQMLATGNLSGKFWRITEVKPNKITATKYQKKITLIYHLKQPVNKGDHISFIAKSSDIIGPDNELLWDPFKIRIHGKSIFKFYFSFISVLMVLTMCLRLIRLDKKTISLIFRNEQD